MKNVILNKIYRLFYYIVGIAFLVLFLFFIKINFLNGSNFNTNLYNLKSGISYSFDHIKINSAKCDNLNQNDIDILNINLEKFGYYGEKKYWCNLNDLVIINLLNSTTNKYIDKNFKIPKEIYKLQNLNRLNLYGVEKLEIKDFENISNLINLVNFSIKSDYGNIEIPQEIYNVKTLKYLYISGKGFTGELDSKIINLNLLKILSIKGTNIGGEIPNELFELHNLKEIFISNNNFIGDAGKLYKKFTNLDSYYISKNKFFGDFPGYISELKTFKK